jgi:multiple sugar transport system substrate-binding protein
MHLTKTVLSGITWDHSRAYPPLVACSQRYGELHPQVRVDWTKRTLHEFGHASVSELAQRYDLVVIDHPALGSAARHGCLLDFSTLLNAELLEDLRTHSVGPSFDSYRYSDHLLAVPIDAATPVASYRPDLLEARRIPVPATWAEVVSLADEGVAIMPGFPADLFLNFLGIYVSLGGELSTDSEPFLQPGTAAEAIELLIRLARHMPREIYTWNPIAIYEMLGANDQFLYCPFAYSYSNYARRGFAAHILGFAEPPILPGNQPLRTILGGTGLAISANCRNVSAAADFVHFVVQGEVQTTLYAAAGGQPAHAKAWDDPALDQIAGRFFSSTRPAMERAYVRPRYDGYIEFQEAAGVPLQSCLQGSMSASEAITEMNRLYRATKVSERG